MKHHIPFLVVSTLIFVKSHVMAMNPEINEASKAPKIVFVTPPEYAETMNALQQII